MQASDDWGTGRRRLHLKINLVGWLAIATTATLGLLRRHTWHGSNRRPTTSPTSNNGVTSSTGPSTDTDTGARDALLSSITTEMWISRFTGRRPFGSWPP